MDRGDRLEEVRRLLDRHLENFGDRLPLVVDLEGFPVIPGAATHLAGDVDVWQEVHLDLQGSVAMACLATTALDVEREPARPVAAHLRLVGRREQAANLIEDTCVGSRVGPRRASDRRLVNLDQLVEIVDAVDAAVTPRHLARSVELVTQRGREDVVDERGLPGAGHACHRAEHAAREPHIDIAKVVFPRTTHV